MGVDVCVWRARIGCFVQPGKKAKFKMAAITISRGTVSMTLKLTLLVSLLLVIAGDVERNPGPGPDGRPGVKTRQTRLTDSQVSDEIAELKALTDALNTRTLALERENKQLRDQVSRLEDQSRRENLIFYGVPESNGKETWEETEQKVREIMKDSMKVPNADSDDDIAIERAHRLPSKMTGRPRPVIVKFSRYKHKDKVWNMKRELKGTDISVSEDFSYEVRNTRRKLTVFMQLARGDLVKSVLKYNKLVIGEETFFLDEATGYLKHATNKKLYTYDSSAKGVKEVTDTSTVS